jgi:HD-like signal output (HDOD) protein
MESPAFRTPLLPQVAEKALDLSSHEGTALVDLGKLVERDQVLAARFLSVANSAIYNRGMPVLSVTAALARIGFVAARDILMFAALEPFFFTHRVFAAETARLRLHSLAVSSACGYLAKLKSMPVEDASLAGLIHDLGASALLHFIAENTTPFATLVGDRSQLNEALGQVHERAGRILASRWELPALLRVAMGDHHKLARTSPMLVQLVCAADDLATRCGAHSGFDVCEGQALELMLGSRSQVATAVVEFRKRVADAQAEAA